MSDVSRDNRRRPICGATLIDLVAVAALAGIIAITATEVGARELLRIGLQSADEISGYLLVLIAFFGLSRALDVQQAFTVDAVTRRLSDPWRQRLGLGSACITLLVLATFTVAFAYLAWTSHRVGSASATLLAVPQALPQAVCTVALAAATAKAAWLLYRSCTTRGD